MNNLKPSRGDKSTLTYDQRMLLENEILPTARRWMHTTLHDHAVATLTFWGEMSMPKGGEA